MKKVRIFLGATALMLTVGATFAFNAHRGFGNTYILSGGQCIVDQACAIGTGSACANSATHYTTRINSTTCQTATTNIHLVAN